MTTKAELRATRARDMLGMFGKNRAKNYVCDRACADGKGTIHTRRDNPN